MQTEGTNKLDFVSNKRELLIPLYQREYKWTDEKIISLISDVRKRDKFLGNIILDETESNYEIVDGQQRITTCYLILIYLFNRYNGHKIEQSLLRGYIKPYNTILLKNNSIGDYITENDNLMKIDINDENDIYRQKGDFKRAYETIENAINTFSRDEINDFKKQLLDSEILVLVNDRHNNTRPIEQLFLDINEKAQLLEVEDIFKGHCFEIYNEEYHSELRNLWVQLRKCSYEFKKFGYEDTSQYIYLFLLENDKKDIPEKLTISGKHYLDGKTMDETNQLLSDMIRFGKSILKFYDNLKNDDYRFRDLCENSHEYRNENDHKILKQMCRIMLEPRGKAQYQKLPFMYLIHQLSLNKNMAMSLTHKDFRRIITNLYIYTSVFVYNGLKKSKESIDHTIRVAIKKEDITTLLNASKLLRVGIIEKLIVPSAYNAEKMYFVYSIIDNYISNDTWISKIYSKHEEDNFEHFIIPNNRNRLIEWVDEDNSFTIKLSLDTVSNFKKKTINLLILNKDLNGEIEHNDIITKIETIKNWYGEKKLPKHISEFIAYIENMPEYKALKELKNTKCAHEEIERKYYGFINAYFDEEHSTMLSNIQTAFRQSFRNS